MIVLANGLNVFPEDVEHVLLADPRSRTPWSSAESGGRTWTCTAVLLGTTAEEAPAVVKAANARLQPHQQIRGLARFWPEEAFPMTPTLKVKRAEVIQAVQTPVKEGAHGGFSRSPQIMRSWRRRCLSPLQLSLRTSFTAPAL